YGRSSVGKLLTAKPLRRYRTRTRCSLGALTKACEVSGGNDAMRILGVHPGSLFYSSIFLRLEPIGLELVAEATRRKGHQVRLLDLQTATVVEYFEMIEDWRPDVIAFSLNYLANVPEVVDLAKATRARLPKSFIFVGGHSASFIGLELLGHGEGAIDCV